MSEAIDPELAEETLLAAEDALRLVCALQPSLSGLAHVVRLSADFRVPTAGIFESGRLLINPAWFLDLARVDAAFVMAHELLHLALRTHARSQGTEGGLFNVAHDYIINDILVDALARPVPADGLEWPGARYMSAEEIVQEIKSGRCPGPQGGSSALAEALSSAGLGSPGYPGLSEDVLSREQERQWFPGEKPDIGEARCQAVAREAARTLSVRKAREGIDKLWEEVRRIGQGTEQGEVAAETEALHTLYRPPWELALQRWMEAVAPGPRSYVRPSRRGAERNDVVLPGRKREGWTLHIVMDTSGSMWGGFGRTLGVIASFCTAIGIDAIHILQCDVGVTRDEYLTPEQLSNFQIDGLGGSDMSPAMQRLAADPEVEAAIVITDGMIYYPSDPMPYAVLWALTPMELEDGDYHFFNPPYGIVLPLGA